MRRGEEGTWGSPAGTGSTAQHPDPAEAPAGGGVVLAPHGANARVGRDLDALCVAAEVDPVLHAGERLDDERDRAGPVHRQTRRGADDALAPVALGEAALLVRVCGRLPA